MENNPQEAFWRNSVGYIIYPESFKDSNNDGIGDLGGIISKLDYLKDLGVNLLWIGPIFASPMDDNGYDVSNYYAINPKYGTMGDLETLIREAHEKSRNCLVLVRDGVSRGGDRIPILIDRGFGQWSQFCLWLDRASWSSHRLDLFGDFARAFLKG